MQQKIHISQLNIWLHQIKPFDQDQFEQIDALITRGAEIDSIVRNTTILMSRVLSDDLRGAAHLLSLGANPNILINGTVNCFSNIQNTCIKACCMHEDREDMFKLLLRYGADVNLSEPIIVAIKKGYTHYLSALITHGAHPNALEYYGETPLILMARRGPDLIEASGSEITDILRFSSIGFSDEEVNQWVTKKLEDEAVIFEELLVAGANLYQKDANGHDVLTNAIRNNNTRAISAILKNLPVDYNHNNLESYCEIAATHKHHACVAIIEAFRLQLVAITSQSVTDHIASLKRPGKMRL